jgi:hypothetical protein
MNLLRENELIYGRLLPVVEPHLIQRYNKALAAFGLKPTVLEGFDIDRTGFSPQVAEELGDEHYLDPNQVNRRFIILSPQQAALPVVHTAFSNTAELLHEFYARNARAIDALTIKDVIYGEIEDQVSEVDDIEDLLSISQVEFKVLSAEDVLGKAAELGRLVDRLKLEKDAWRDDALLERMVALATVTGDIRENALVPDQVVFRHNAYWANHFGGIYIFIDADMTTVVCDPEAPGFRRSRPWQVSYLSIHDAERVFAFLAETGRIELPRASWIESSGYLDNRAERALERLVHEADPGREMGRPDKVWLQTFMHANAGLVAKDGTVPFLNAARRELSQTGQMRLADVEPERRFLLVRARPDHPDAWLTNRLISEFVPDDFLSRYVFHKQAFYRDYRAFPDSWRRHVVATLKDAYLKDKAALRARLYGLD